MKSLLLLVSLFLPLLSHSQITFDYMSSPKDFSLGVVRKSPVGEYFVQANDEVRTIYTSFDGVDWTHDWLSSSHELYDIQFYSDGTPLLKPERGYHQIRRDGKWFVMNLGGDYVEASFIRDDTLFVYHEDSFAYSLDKGISFTIIFDYDNIVDHTARLWKFENHFVLHHTGGASDYLSVFNQQGERVLNDTLELSFTSFINYSSCGHVLFNDLQKYYLLKEDGLDYTSGPVTDIIPVIDYDSYIQAAGDKYYHRYENTIFISSGCNFVWEYLDVDDLIESNEYIWISEVGEIFLYNSSDDFFTIRVNGTWEEFHPSINHPHILDVDESANGYQFSLTTNGLFRKNIDEENWIELDSSGSVEYQIQYSPGGGLYIAREKDILYSTDNGQSFVTLPLPNTEYPLHRYLLEVLDDNILFLVHGIFGHGYFTLNNSQDWIGTDLSVNSETPKLKLVENEILIADLDYQFIFTKINVVTNETTSETFSRPTGFDYADVVILDNGIIYFKAHFFTGDNKYYRYNFGGDLEYLGSFSALGYVTLASSGNSLFAFAADGYYLFNGQTFSHYNYENFPVWAPSQFKISENEYLYGIVDKTGIRRSYQPLSLPTSAKDADSFLDFNIFPNPALNEINVTIDDGDVQRIDAYEIIDRLGRVVNQSNMLNQKINVAQLTPGVYGLILKENGIRVGMNKFVRL